MSIESCYRTSSFCRNLYELTSSFFSSFFSFFFFFFMLCKVKTGCDDDYLCFHRPFTSDYLCITSGWSLVMMITCVSPQAGHR